MAAADQDLIVVELAQYLLLLVFATVLPLELLQTLLQLSGLHILLFKLSAELLDYGLLL